MAGFWEKLRTLVFLGAVLLPAGASCAFAGEEWQVRFEEVCAKTGEVMSLTPTELDALLTECEWLQERVEALPESPRKVYRKRLALSCNLIRFAIEQKRPVTPQE